jgi:hypothetical protein
MTLCLPVYPYGFEAEIEKFGVGRDRKIWYNVLFLPPDLRSQLPFDTYPRLRVEGEIADVPIANAFIPAGDGRNYVIVSPQVLRDAGVGLGDWVEMRFRIADQNHVDVPEALNVALRADPAAQTDWDSLSPGRKRMVVQHVLSAKSSPTRQRRVAEALDAVLRFNGDINAGRRARKV